jgi:nitrate reductase (cytochrome), electron transfer subunit
MRGQDRRRLSSLRSLTIPSVAVAGTVAFAFSALSQQSEPITIIPPLTGAASPMNEVSVPPLARPITDDVRRMRNYPEQPPIIPHSIDGYQITLNTNRCLSCHKREFTESSGAPMISITHFMDRDGQVLSDVTPRRYFCTQCHVQQTDAPPLVGNTFQDASAVRRGQR